MKKVFYFLAFAACASALYFILRKKIASPMNEKENENESLSLLNKEYLRPYKFEITNDIEDSVVNYILHKEGGLSKEVTDSASKYPVGVPFTYKGVTSDKWHTNKGVTWQAYKGATNELNLKGTPEAFYNLSNNEWFKIYAVKYYKPMRLTDSKKVNLYLSLWAWGSGVGGAKSFLKSWEEKNGDLNSFLKTNGEKKTIESLVLKRISDYKAITARKMNEVKADSTLTGEQKEKRLKALENTLKAWINGALNFNFYFNK